MQGFTIPRQLGHIKIDLGKDDIKVHKVINLNDIQHIAEIFKENRDLRYLSIQHQQNSQIIIAILNIIPTSSIRILFIGYNDIVRVRDIEHYLLKLILSPNCKLTIIRGNIKIDYRISDDFKEEITKSLQNNIFLIEVMGIHNIENRIISKLFNEYKNNHQSSSSIINDDITKEETLVPFMEYIYQKNNIDQKIKDKIIRYIDRKWKNTIISRFKEICPICYVNKVDLVICQNEHKICSECWKKVRDKKRCPVSGEDIENNYSPTRYIPNINDIDIDDIDIDDIDIKNIILETQIYKYPSYVFTRNFLNKCSDNAIRKIFEIYIKKTEYEKYFNYLENEKFEKTKHELNNDKREQYYNKKFATNLKKMREINNSLLKQNTTSSKQNTIFKFEPINVENDIRKDIIKFGNFEYNRDGKIDIIDFNEKTTRKINEIKNENIKNDVKDKLKRSSRFRKYFNNNGTNIEDINFRESFPNNNDIIQMEF